MRIFNIRILDSIFKLDSLYTKINCKDLKIF